MILLTIVECHLSLLEMRVACLNVPKIGPKNIEWCSKHDENRSSFTYWAHEIFTQ